MTSYDVVRSGLVSGEQEFDGVPLGDLVFEDVDWSMTREHVEKRAERKGTTEFAPKTEWATEACQDECRLVGRTAMAVYVIGWSDGCQRLLRVVVRPMGHAKDGEWYGLTAHAAPDRDRKQYEQAKEES